MPRAVVFAYHDVGVRCLRVLLAHGVDVPLVVTHARQPGRDDLVRQRRAPRAAEHGIAVHRARRSERAGRARRASARCAPDFLFSFYYRQMLTRALLHAAAARRLNMHGSLLPQVPRPRAGELGGAPRRARDRRDAALHDDEARRRRHRRPERGADPARRHRARGVRQGDRRGRDRARRARCRSCSPARRRCTPQDLAQGSYFGGRTARGRRASTGAPARAQIHNLVRAVAPPYPGAFTSARRAAAQRCCARCAADRAARAEPPRCECAATARRARCCVDGGALRVLAARARRRDTATLDARLRARASARAAPARRLTHSSQATPRPWPCKES